MTKKKNWMNDNNGDTAGSDAYLFHSGGGFFEIHVKGQLDSRWSEWLEGLDVTLLENGEMILFGPIVDQAALMGRSGLRALFSYSGDSPAPSPSAGTRPASRRAR